MPQHQPRLRQLQGFPELLNGKRQRGRPPTIQSPSLPPPSEWLTRSSFARWFDSTPQTVTRWVQEGKLPAELFRSDGSIHAARGLEALKKSGALADGDKEQPDLAALFVGTSMVSYDEARAFSEVLRAHRAHLDLRERQGELLRRDIAESVLFEAGRSIRDHWLNWPPRVAAEMGAAIGVTPAVMLATLEKFVHAHLDHMAAPEVNWRARPEEEAEE